MQKLSNNKSVVIHKHSLKCGGIGDFIRASLSLFSYCQRNKIDYYINFDQNSNLKYCFDIEKMPEYFNNLPIREIILTNGIYTIEKIKPFLELFDKNGIYYVKTNAIGYEKNEEINKIRDYFFNNILKPTQKVKQNIDDIYTKYNLINNNYISIHIRCGDLNMDNNHSNSNDIRLDLNDDNIFINYNLLINDFKKNYGDNMPIIIHSDSIIFKNKIKKLNNDIIILDIDIKHIAEDIGNNNEQYYISTVSEFYILSQSNKIYMPLIYTGFSHIASLINNKPLYTKINSEYFEFLNINNIKII